MRAATKNILIYIIFYFHKSFRFFNLKSFSIVSKKEFLLTTEKKKFRLKNSKKKNEKKFRFPKGKSIARTLFKFQDNDDGAGD